MYLEPHRQEIVNSLINANMSFDTADNQLFRFGLLKLSMKLLSAAGANACLFEDFDIVRKSLKYFCSCMTQAFWVLFSDDDRQILQACTLYCNCDSIDALIEVWDRGAKSLLHVDDEECRPREFKNIWVLHVIDFREGFKHRIFPSTNAGKTESFSIYHLTFFSCH
jgi:hypothetical protein